MSFVPASALDVAPTGEDERDESSQGENEEYTDVSDEEYTRKIELERKRFHARHEKWKRKEEVIYCKCCSKHGEKTKATRRVPIYFRHMRGNLLFYLCGKCKDAELSKCIGDCYFTCSKHRCECLACEFGVCKKLNCPNCTADDQ
jgi:hypothetical protein